MNDCCRAAVVEELRAQVELLRRKGHADMPAGGFAAGLLVAATQLEGDADALEGHTSVLVDQQP